MFRKYPPSIITNDMSKCYLCGATRNIEIHHIFPSGLRKKSTQYGLVVPLCHNCHQGTNGVHQSRKKMDYLKKIAQEKWMAKYPDKDWLKEFHRNYLDYEI